MARCPSEDWDRYVAFEDANAEAAEIDESARKVCADYWGSKDATWEQMARYAFKYTESGISFYHTESAPGQVLIGGYCESVDQECPSYALNWPFKRADVARAVKRADQDAIDLWNETHGCEDCGDLDGYGYRQVNPKCKTCNGSGVVL